MSCQGSAKRVSRSRHAYVNLSERSLLRIVCADEKLELGAAIALR
jgi:hypothetical protein